MKQQDWISVKDGLPEIILEHKCSSALVLTINEAGEIKTGGMHDWDDDDSAYWWTMKYGGTTADDITHWMPLPEAPK